MLFLRLFLLLFAFSCPLHASHCLLIGVAGGSGSGKTTLANAIVSAFGDEAVVISQDSYYRDQSDLPWSERVHLNFDHPDAIDFPLLQSHLKQLKNGEGVEVPTYDFSTHQRSSSGRWVAPRTIVLVEGILLLALPEMRDLFDIKFYVDTDADIRLLRRIARDINERGRSLDSVIAQYQETVYPMFLQFVEPSKRYADLIIPALSHNQAAIDLITARLQAHRQQVQAK